MTVKEALERVKRDRPGEATDAELKKWLRDADVKWSDEVLATHWLSPLEVQAAGLGMQRDTLQTREKMLYLALKSDNPAWNVFFQPWDDETMGGTHGMPVVQWPCFDRSRTVYGGAIRTADMDAVSEIVFSATDGTEEQTLTVMRADAGTAVWQDDDGRVFIGWGYKCPTGEDHAEVTFELMGYTVTIWRYFEGAREEDSSAPAEGEELTVETSVQDMELLIPAPDDEVYIYWLYSHIDMRLGELDRYNNDAMMYNAAWLEAAKRFNRCHRPKGRQLRHVLYGRLPVPRGPEDPLDQRGDRFRIWG